MSTETGDDAFEGEDVDVDEGDDDEVDDLQAAEVSASPAPVRKPSAVEVNMKLQIKELQEELARSKQAAVVSDVQPAAADNLTEIWWAEHPDFPQEYIGLPSCPVNPPVNTSLSDSDEQKRVRAMTKAFWKDITFSEHFYPMEPEGSFDKVPSEIFIRLLTFAREEPYNLPWNAKDLNDKVPARLNHVRSRSRRIHPSS